jgi:hypothetical protein
MRYRHWASWYVRESKYDQLMVRVVLVFLVCFGVGLTAAANWLTWPQDESGGWRS